MVLRRPWAPAVCLFVCLFLPPPPLLPAAELVALCFVFVVGRCEGFLLKHRRKPFFYSLRVLLFVAQVALFFSSCKQCVCVRAFCERFVFFYVFC